ncbi:MAG TPA: hypothetical protein VNX67_09735, partial [Solirubrobacteraceae bacterium]|nr:hypothetical protein [Solirubrobacteraceae bacterium]
MAHKVESEGKLQFYTPEQVVKLLAQAYSTTDEAICTVATEAGPRLSEIRSMKVRNVDSRSACCASRTAHNQRWARGQQGPAGPFDSDDSQRPRLCTRFARARAEIDLCSSTTPTQASR